MEQSLRLAPTKDALKMLSEIKCVGHTEQSKRPSRAVIKDVPTLPKKEDSVTSMEQSGRLVFVKDAPTMPNREECASDMGRSECVQNVIMKDAPTNLSKMEFVGNMVQRI
mmetsp:Transcript_6539/g.14258  ORF Transcript_6539/g.14258 Transcript_6539/m.14258 type:complete len:110 (+) Transcript_6539:153-482(+)